MVAQIINALLGVFLMAAPGLLGLGPTASDNFQIFGPVITTFAVVSWWEATRTVRLWNVPIGAWLVISPIFLDYGRGSAVAVAIIVGAAVIGLAFVKGKVEKRYGGGWAALRGENPPHQQEALARKPRHTESKDEDPQHRGSEKAENEGAKSERSKSGRAESERSESEGADRRGSDREGSDSEGTAQGGRST